jgi:hypothetical protein
MLIKHVVRLGLLLLAPQPLDLSPHLGQLGGVYLLLVGNAALVLSVFGIVAAPEGVCLARLGLQLALEVLGGLPLARLFLL